MMNLSTKMQTEQAAGRKPEAIGQALHERIDLLQDRLSSLEVNYPPSLWEKLHTTLSVSTASAALPSLEGLMETESSSAMKSFIGCFLEDYTSSPAFYTHQKILSFPPMTIHLGQSAEGWDADTLGWALSSEIAHALSLHVIEDCRGKALSHAVGELYETAFSWWTNPLEEGNYDIMMMRTAHLYRECMRPGQTISEAASEAVSLLKAKGLNTAADKDAMTEALINNFELLEEDFPRAEGSALDPHVIAGWIGYSLLEGIAALTGRKPRDCMDGLTRVAALALYDDVDFSSPERFVETVTSRLGGYLAAGKTS